MNKLFIAAIFLLICKLAYSQDYWQIIDLADTIEPHRIGIDLNDDVFLTSNNGVYKSTDEGISWHHLGDYYNEAWNIAFMSNNDIYINGGGVWKSSNGGQNWKVINQDFGINALHITEDDIIFVGTLGAIYKSIDSGYTMVPVYTTYNTHVFNDFEEVGNNLYAGSVSYMLEPGGVFKSSDGGDSWALFALEGHGISSLDKNNDGNIYAGSIGAPIGSGPGLFRSDIDGLNWEHIYAQNEVSSILVTSWEDIFVGLESDLSVDYGVRYSSNLGYQWEDITSGIPNNSYNIQLVPSASNYIYTIIYYPYMLFRSINPVVGIEDNSIQNAQFKVFPNPCSSTINISFDKNTDFPFLLELYNNSGEMIFSQYIYNNTCLSIDVTEFPEGVYYIGYKNKDDRIFNRFIKIN